MSCRAIKIKENIYYSNKLYKINPNPFNNDVIIRYSVVDLQPVLLYIYDVSGRPIKILVNEIKSPGEYSVGLDGKDLTPGIYFCRIKLDKQTFTQKIIKF